MLDHRQYIDLAEPGKIGRMEVKNRIVMAPMGTHASDRDGYVTDQMSPAQIVKMWFRR